jgi:hypothetical protein
MMDRYREAIRELDEAFEACSDSREYLEMILRILAGHGILEGEWSCELREAV